MHELAKLAQTCSEEDVSIFIRLILDRDFAKFNIAIQHGIIMGIKEFESKRNCWYELRLACRTLDCKTKIGKRTLSAWGGAIFRKLCYDNDLTRMSQSEREAFNVWLHDRSGWKTEDYDWLNVLIALGQLKKEEVANA